MAAKKASEILKNAVSGVGAFDLESAVAPAMPPKISDAIDKIAVTPASFHFEYEKSTLHRVIYADGIYGGVAPRGNHLNISFFSERWPIPKEADFVPSAADEAWAKVGGGEPQSVKIRRGIFREVEITVVMDLQAAQSFHHWLGEKISSLVETNVVYDRLKEKP